MAYSIYLMLLLLVWLAIIASGVLWGKFLYRCKTGQEAPGNLVPMQRRQRPFWTLADFLLLFGALLLGLVIFTTLFVQQGWIGPAVASESAEEATPSLQTLIARIAANSLAGILAVTLTLLWLSLLRPTAIRDLGIIPERLDIGLGLRASLWILPPVGLVSLLVSLLVPYEHPVLDTLAESPSLTVFASMFVGTAIIAPFVEEFMFRVILQGSLDRIADGPHSDTTDTVDAPLPANQGQLAVKPTNQLAAAYQPPSELLTPSEFDSANNGGPGWAPAHYWPIVVTSLVFSFMHYGQGAAPIPLFVLSLALGYLYRQTGRITAPLVVHMVLNTITLCVEFTRFLAESSS